MTVTNVREARFELGKALAARQETTDEARSQLARALDEPGTEPRQWEIHAALSQLARDNADDIAALEHLLQAVLVAPVDNVDQPASEALRLIDGSDGSMTVQRLDDRVVKDIARTAAHLDSPVVPTLAAKLALLRGDLPSAEGIARGHGESFYAEDAALQVADVASKAVELLRHMDAEQAISLLDSHPRLENEPTLKALRALTCFALGDDDEALALTSSIEQDVNLATVSALAKLSKAASATGVIRADLVNEALTDAVRAARLEPRSPEPLILRGQVLLEGDIDPEQGRQLVDRGIHRLSGDPAGILWYRVQSKVRTDELYSYFAIETAARLDRHEEVIERAAGMQLTTTSYRQDGAIWRLVAEAHVRLDESRKARDAYIEASTALASARESEASLDCIEKAYALGPDASAGMALAERLWFSTFSNDLVPEDGSERLSHGITVLDQIDAQIQQDDLGFANLVRGLTLSRAANLGRPLAGNWDPIPFLLLGAELSPDNSYASAHLSFALQAVNLDRAALNYANRAFELSPWDDWVQERLILCQLSWAGSLEPEIEHLLEDVGEEEWRSTVRAVQNLLNGRTERLVQQIETLTAHDLGTQETKAYAVATCSGFDAARSLFERLAERTRDSENADEFLTFLGAALRLNLDDAREALDQQRRHPEPFSPQLEALFRARLRLIETDGKEGGDEIDSWLRTVSRPARLLEQANVSLPTLAAAYPQRPGASSALTALADSARRRLGELTPASSTSDVESGDAWTSDTAMRKWVLRLLTATESTAGGRRQSAAVLHALVDVPFTIPRATSAALHQLAEGTVGAAR